MTLPMEQDPELERVTNRIIALVNEHFARGEERFYLSGLGSLLGEDKKLLEKLSKRKLADFVEHVMGYEIGKTGQHLNVLHIVRPASAGPATPSARRKSPKFISEIWNAFSVPLEDNERRFIDIVTKTVSTDPNVLPAAVGAVREITPEFVTDGSLKSVEIGDRILRWLEQEMLDPALFIASSRRDSDAPSLLQQMLELLDGDQLKRTTLPLDVVKALSERPGR